MTTSRKRKVSSVAANSVRSVIIVAGVIRRGDAILLVQQQGSGDPHPAWALPGGRVEPGESLLETLAREVREETGLTVKQTGVIIGVTHTIDKITNSQSLAFIVQVESWEGDLFPADPDCVILGAAFVQTHEAISRLQTTIPWENMREPSIAAIRGDQPPGTIWLYQDEGEHQKLLSITLNHTPQAIRSDI